MKTFKEQLTEKVKTVSYDISDHMKVIKLRMEEFVQDRRFTINLVEPKADQTLALGTSRGPIYQTFIPKNVEPHVYMKLFTVALKELGFKDEDIENGAGETDYCYNYSITVRW